MHHVFGPEDVDGYPSRGLVEIGGEFYGAFMRGVFRYGSGLYAEIHRIPLGVILAPPSLGDDGRLYGVASAGGSKGLGTVFAYDPVGGVFTVLHNFDGNKGAQPSGELLLAQQMGGGVDAALSGLDAQVAAVIAASAGIEARIEQTSILYSTLVLFAVSGLLALIVLAALIWWVVRKGKRPGV